MFFRFLLQALFLILGYGLYAQQGVIRAKLFGGEGIENSIIGIKKYEGGYLAVGKVNYGNDGFYFIKYDTAFNEINRRNTGSSTSVALSSDGGYITVTTLRDAIHNWSNDYCVVKYDANNVRQWRYYYGGFSDDNVSSVVQLINGNYLIIGNTTSTDGDVVGKTSSDQDIWIIELNAAGQIVKQKVLGAGNNEHNPGIYIGDNDIIAYCNTNSVDGIASGNHGGEDLLLMHLDNNLNFQWSKCIGGSGDESISTFTRAGSGEIYLGGSTNSTDGDIPGSGSYTDGFVVKLSSTGALIWSKLITGTYYDQVSQVFVLANGNLGVTGWYNSGEIIDVSRPVQHNYEEGMLIVMNSTGEVLWSKSIGSDCTEMAYGVTEAYNGNLVVCGMNFYCSTNGDFAGLPFVAGESRGYLLELKSSMNTIKGSVFFDNNNNKIKDAGDNYYLSSYGRVESFQGAYSTNLYLLNGKFLISTDTGDYSSSLRGMIDLDTTAYGFTPKKKITHFLPGVVKDSFDFRIVPIGLVKDLEVSLVQMTESFVNNSVRYLVRTKNLGDASLDSAFIKIKLNDKLRFLSAGRTPFAISSDTITWKYSPVPGQFLDSFDVFFKVNNSLATIGTPLNLTSIAEPYVTDFDTLDNKMSTSSVIMGQNSAVSNFIMDFTVKDSARTNRPVKYDIVYSFTSLLDSLKGTVKVIKSPFSNCVSAQPIPVSVKADTITWNFKDLAHFDGDTIQVVLRALDSPATTIGNTLLHKARIELQTNDTALIIIEKNLSQRILGYYIEPDMTNPILLPPNGTKWTRSFGGTGKDYLYGIVALPDSGFIVTGSSNSNDNDIVVGESNTDAFISRFDKDGMVKWTKTLGGNEEDALYAVTATSDNNFVACGYTRVPYGPLPHGAEEGWIVKFRENGDTIWCRKLGSVGVDIFYAIKEMPDKGFIISGQTTAGGGDVSGYIPIGYSGFNMWIIKVDSLGSIQWQKCIAEPSLGYIGTGVDLTADGKIIVSGKMFPEASAPQINGFVTKLDTNGLQLWAKKFSYLHLYYEISGVVANPDSTIIVIGSVGTYYNDTLFYGGHGQSDCWMTKLDKNGMALWTKYFGGSYFDYALSIFRTYSGNFLVAGKSFSGDGNNTKHYGDPYNSDAWLLEVDPDGKLIWQHTVGGTGNDLFAGVAVLPSSDILVIGSTNSNNNGDIHSGHGDLDGLIAKIGKANMIEGQVFVDKNNNGLKDTDDPSFSNGTVEIGNPDFISAAALKDGRFTITTDTGRIIVRLITADSGYYSIVPKTDTVHFSNYPQRDSVNFRFVEKGPINDLRIDLLPLSTPRPGFNSDYLLKYENKGTTNINNVKVQFVADNKTQFLTSSLPNTLIRGDTIIWIISQLKSLQSGSIGISLKVKPPPVVIFGTYIGFTGLIEPLAGDSTPFNNISQLVQMVRGSFDPNDKSELHNGKITSEMIEGEEYLTYVIRFQNTGNDTAFNVIIRDTLDLYLDWSTLEMIGSSHPYELIFKDKNKLEWLFKDIQLPDSNINEPASHGFTSFRIKVKKVAQLSDTIKNNASIYFDFNLPELTNTVQTTIENDLSTTCPGGNIFLISKFPGITYKWQLNTGTGYTDISDNSIYLGSSSDTLRVTGVSPGWYGYKYRCRITTSDGTVYSPEYKLKIQAVWKGNESKVWENPANWNCGIVPDENTDIVIESGLNNYPEVNSNISCRSILIKPYTTLTIKPGFKLTLKGK